MTAEEKAKELVNKYGDNISIATNQESNDFAKQCALICVDEMLKIFEGLHKPEYTLFDIYEPRQYAIGEEDFNGYDMQSYWQQVKAEIEKL